METFRELRENNKIIAALVAWQKTVWYPVFYAVCGVLSCSFGWQVYVPVFYILALTVLFAALFCDDIKVLLTPVFLTYFCIGSDVELNLDISTGNVFQTWSTGGLVNMIIAGVILIGSIVFRFIHDGLLVDIFRKRGILTTGMACIAFALVFNGVFSPTWQPLDLAFGLLIAGGLMLMYFVVLAVSNHTHDLVNYICTVCLVCGLMIGLQAVILLARTAANGQLFVTEAGQLTGRVDRHYLVLGWGVANLVAGMLALLIPPVMYLAYCRRYCVVSYLSAVFMYVVIVLLNARTSMLMGGIILIVCIIICCFGKNRSANRLLTLFIVLATVLGVIISMSVIGFDKLPDYIANLLRLSDGDSARFPRWLNGMGDFAKAPVFGAGFMDGGVDVGIDGNMYSNMYHNIGVEILGSLGIVGVLAFIVHIKGMLELCLRKFRTERFLIGLGAVTVLMISLLDNFFFYFSAQIFYGAYLAVAEVQLEYTRADLLKDHKRARASGKPRVAFTFVEAGMGHIVPEAAVCDAFERKYGDKCEVVRSRFYTETDNTDMHNFEDGFVRAVQLQSRSRVFGKLCIFGNKLAGDALAQQFVMSMRYPDSRAGRTALKHLRELDADVLFTTHWATAYYVGKLKKDRPYTIMFCPDAYSNGMFNIDCNDFLIPTEEGLKKANHRRMYAGGNGRVVPYPIRDEAFALRGKKAEVRASLGIGTDEFVVILADGGYGMAKLEKTVGELITCGRADGKTRLRIIAACGKNEEAAERLRSLELPSNITLDVYGYTDRMLELVCASDLFVGKSGANSMAEPTFFGLPVIITKCITPIESGIRKYYMKTVGNAMYIPDPKKAAEKIFAFASDPVSLEPYARRALSVADSYGAEAIADLIYDRVSKLAMADDNRYTVRYNASV